MRSPEDLIFDILQQRFHRLLKTQGITMKNTQKNTQPDIHQGKTQTSQIPKLQPLELEHLYCVAGGTVYPCPDCPE